MSYHIFPKNDIKEHVLVGTTCHCNPVVIEEDGKMIIVHNSYDGREGLEMAKKILDNETERNS